jgi:hypothetical protein
MSVGVLRSGLAGQSLRLTRYLELGRAWQIARPGITAPIASAWASAG